MVLCDVSNILSNLLRGDSLSTRILSALGSPALLCVLGNRLLFNLKEAARTDEGSKAFGLSSISFHERSEFESFELRQLNEA